MMGYVAVKPLRIGGETRHPGEPVPEAVDWHPNARNANLQAGRIREVPDAEMPRRRGRPPGSRNRSTFEAMAQQAEDGEESVEESDDEE